MFTPLVTYADKESRIRLTIINPGSLVTKLRRALAGAEIRPMKGSSGMFKLVRALMSSASGVR